MANLQLTRRDFLNAVGVAGLVYRLQNSSPTVNAAQREEVRGFDALRACATQLFDETESNNYERNKNGDFIPRLDREIKFPFLLRGEISGRKAEVLVHKALLSGPYSLEAKTYFNRNQIPFGGNSDLEDLAKTLLFPNFASNVFF